MKIYCLFSFLVFVVGCQTTPDYSVSAAAVSCPYGPLSFYIGLDKSNDQFRLSDVFHVDCVALLTNETDNDLNVYSDETEVGFMSIVLEIKNKDGSICRTSRILHKNVVFSDLYYVIAPNGTLAIPLSFSPSLWHGHPFFPPDGIIQFRVGIKSSILVAPPHTACYHMEPIMFSPWISMKYRSRTTRYSSDLLGQGSETTCKTPYQDLNAKKNDNGAIERNRIDVKVVRCHP